MYIRGLVGFSCTHENTESERGVGLERPRLPGPVLVWVARDR